MRLSPLGLILLLLLIHAAWSSTSTTDKQALRNLPIFIGFEQSEISHTQLIQPSSPNPSTTDEYLGDVDTVGWTWWAYQHHGTCGRMIRIDSLDNIHVVWMRGFVYNTVRHVYYNLWNQTMGWVWGDEGTPVESSNRAGYTCLGVNSGGRPFAVFNARQSAADDYHVAVAVDLFPPYGVFQYWYLPQGPQPILMEPKIDVDSQGKIQLVYISYPAYPSITMQLWYCRGTFDSVAAVMDYISPIYIDSTVTYAPDIAASHYSDRVAIVYAGMRETLGGNTNHYNNDIYLIVSEDGITWDFNHPINVTNFIYPDTSLFPDTLAAMGDTLRAYNDASILFDENDNIHIAFTTPYFDEVHGLISINNSLIWHWSEDTRYYSLVADGWFGAVPCECGSWQRFVQRPCLALDESTGDLFITYQLYDTNDVAATAHFQGEIMISRSTSGGMYWSEGTNVSNTHYPGAGPDNCLSEHDITCHEIAVDTALHLLYVLDTECSHMPPYEWGSLCPVQYQRVPIAEIPATPLMPVYPMHVDSTGMPPLSVPEMVENATVPLSFRLYQNYPNPFNPITTIRFDLSRSDLITLKIFNLIGQRVTTLAEGKLLPGSYHVQFDATDLASGVYFYQLTSSHHIATRKMVLLK